MKEKLMTVRTTAQIRFILLKLSTIRAGVPRNAIFNEAVAYCIENYKNIDFTAISRWKFINTNVDYDLPDYLQFKTDDNDFSNLTLYIKDSFTPKLGGCTCSWIIKITMLAYLFKLDGQIADEQEKSETKKEPEPELNLAEMAKILVDMGIHDSESTHFKDIRQIMKTWKRLNEID